MEEIDLRVTLDALRKPKITINNSVTLYERIKRINR
jgi:hypothetical protein